MENYLSGRVKDPQLSVSVEKQPLYQIRTQGHIPKANPCLGPCCARQKKEEQQQNANKQQQIELQLQQQESDHQNSDRLLCPLNLATVVVLAVVVAVVAVVL